MKCPHCNKDMTKITSEEARYLSQNSFFYKCSYCNYISAVYTEETKPFEDKDNYSRLPAPGNDNSLEDWRWRKKWDVEKNLKKEIKKINKKMYDKFGNITDDDKIDLQIDLYLFNKEAEKQEDGIPKL